MVKNLENFYYYLSEGDKGVVYEISYVQDKDKCGKHLVTYMTEPKELTAGAYYYDLHGDKQKVEEAGTYQVKKEDGSLDLEACKSVFPYVEVKYYKALRDPRTGAYIKDGQGNYVKDTETLYIDMYWYQDRIQDGDTVDENGKFVMKPDHHVYEDSQTYIDDVESATWSTVTSLIMSGADDDRLYSTAPLYIGKDAGWIKHFNSRVIVTDVTNSENKEFDFSKTAINDKIAEIVQEKILNEYADMMSKYDIPIDWPEPCECPECPECPEYYYLNNLQTISGNDFFNTYNFEERTFIEEHYDVTYAEGYTVLGCAPLGDIPESELPDYIKMYTPMYGEGINITESEYEELNECEKDNYEEVYCLVMRTYTVKEEYAEFSSELGNLDTYDRFTYEIRHKFYVKQEK